MILKNSLIYINQFFFFIFSHLRNFYLNSSIYNNKISKVNSNNLEFKPNISLLGYIVKYSRNKKNIDNFILNDVWSEQNLRRKDFKNLHSFFWLFTIDLKSSKNKIQKVIINWINKNYRYNHESWEIDILSKRIISWISNSKITYENSEEDYKKKFDKLIKKQINHLINEIERSKGVDDKILGCAAIILGGLAYEDKIKFLNYGLKLLKKIIRSAFDKEGFPKSRNLRQLNFYLKYFILIREWLKESQSEIPEYLDEIIYYLGQSYFLINKSSKTNYLFNGNHISNGFEFENYISRLGYKFKSKDHEAGGYIFLKNKKFELAMDIGPSPERRFSKDYQSGALSFEFVSNGKKIVTNSGYFQNYKHQLNFISKTTACQNTLVLGNSSSAQFFKKPNGTTELNGSVKILDKNIILKDNYWFISAAHDGYLKRFGVIHKRRLEYFNDTKKIMGIDKIIRKKKGKKFNFEIRFHLDPNTKVMKTQDNKVIYIECENEAWKFTADKYNMNFETGLFFGFKNQFLENQNIVISGNIQNENKEIKWEIEKI